MTTVYLIRHAEAEGNVYRRCHGQYDSLLTPRAYEQLPCLAERFAAVPLDAVYASDLFRARTTAQAVAAPHGLGVETRPALREIDMGDWEDIPWAELPRLWRTEYALWRSRPWDATPPHGESVMQAGERMLAEVRALARRHAGGQIAVVTHGSAIRGALTLAYGLAPEQMGEVGWGDNTCVAKLELDENGGAAVVYANDASHLPEALSTFASIGWKDNKAEPETPQLWFRRFEPRNPADGELLLSLARGAGVDTPQEELSESVLRALHVSPRAVTFGCLESGEEVALVYLKAHEDDAPDVGVIGALCVSEAYRRRGLGSQLLGQAISAYRAMGRAWLCAEPDARGAAFYQRHSFAPRGENGAVFRKIGID